MQTIIRPVSAIIPTANRANVLRATLNSLSQQNVQPAEIIIVDASDSEDTFKISNEVFENLLSKIVYAKATQKGAASQRNQGVELAENDFIFFCDDDIIFEPNCIERLWNGINSDDNIGAVNSMVTNQRYLTPGKLTRIMYRLMSGQTLPTYAGKCIGPAWNLMPEDDPSLPELVKMEWVNTTCTIYRRSALPTPVFSSHFKGYSMFEDLTLSSIIGRKWELRNARTARIFHDSQPGSHKNSLYALAKMETVNRYYVMTEILHRGGFKYFFKLVLLELFAMVAMASSPKNFKKLPAFVGGKIAGFVTILFKKQPQY